ncbi:MAG: response regulator, partial [Candidatus Omnitrophica bacterium]|nr:response regulator [Candidatus Omnitrophota bacterium]
MNEQEVEINVIEWSDLNVKVRVLIKPQILVGRQDLKRDVREVTFALFDNEVSKLTLSDVIAWANEPWKNAPAMRMKRILIVSQKINSPQNMAAHLKYAGYEVVSANDKYEALELYNQREGFDLIIIEKDGNGSYEMPYQEIINKLREKKTDQKIIVRGYKWHIKSTNHPGERNGFDLNSKWQFLETQNVIPVFNNLHPKSFLDAVALILDPEVNFPIVKRANISNSESDNDYFERGNVNFFFKSSSPIGENNEKTGKRLELGLNVEDLMTIYMLAPWNLDEPILGVTPEFYANVQLPLIEKAEKAVANIRIVDPVTQEEGPVRIIDHFTGETRPFNIRQKRKEMSISEAKAFALVYTMINVYLLRDLVGQGAFNDLLSQFEKDDLYITHVTGRSIGAYIAFAVLAGGLPFTNAVQFLFLTGYFVDESDILARQDYIFVMKPANADELKNFLETRERKGKIFITFEFADRFVILKRNGVDPVLSQEDKISGFKIEENAQDIIFNIKIKFPDIKIDLIEDGFPYYPAHTLKAEKVKNEILSILIEPTVLRRSLFAGITFDGLSDVVESFDSSLSPDQLKNRLIGIVAPFISARFNWALVEKTLKDKGVYLINVATINTVLADKNKTFMAMVKRAIKSAKAGDHEGVKLSKLLGMIEELEKSAHTGIYKIKMPLYETRKSIISEPSFIDSQNIHDAIQAVAELLDISLNTKELSPRELRHQDPTESVIAKYDLVIFIANRDTRAYAKLSELLNQDKVKKLIITGGHGQYTPQIYQRALEFSKDQTGLLSESEDALIALNALLNRTTDRNVLERLKDPAFTTLFTGTNSIKGHLESVYLSTDFTEDMQNSPYQTLIVQEPLMALRTVGHFNAVFDNQISRGLIEGQVLNFRNELPVAEDLVGEMFRLALNLIIHDAKVTSQNGEGLHAIPDMYWKMTNTIYDSLDTAKKMSLSEKLSGLLRWKNIDKSIFAQSSQEEVVKFARFTNQGSSPILIEQTMILVTQTWFGPILGGLVVFIIAEIIRELMFVEKVVMSQEEIKAGLKHERDVEYFEMFNRSYKLSRIVGIGSWMEYGIYLWGILIIATVVSAFIAQVLLDDGLKRSLANVVQFLKDKNILKFYTGEITLFGRSSKDVKARAIARRLDGNFNVWLSEPYVLRFLGGFLPIAVHIVALDDWRTLRSRIRSGVKSFGDLVQTTLDPLPKPKPIPARYFEEKNINLYSLYTLKKRELSERLGGLLRWKNIDKSIFAQSSQEEVVKFAGFLNENSLSSSPIDGQQYRKNRIENLAVQFSQIPSKEVINELLYKHSLPTKIVGYNRVVGNIKKVVSIPGVIRAGPRRVLEINLTSSALAAKDSKDDDGLRRDEIQPSSSPAQKTFIAAVISVLELITITTTSAFNKTTEINKLHLGSNNHSYQYKVPAMKPVIQRFEWQGTSIGKEIRKISPYVFKSPGQHGFNVQLHPNFKDNPLYMDQLNKLRIYFTPINVVSDYHVDPKFTAWDFRVMLHVMVITPQEHSVYRTKRLLSKSMKLAEERYNIDVPLKAMVKEGFGKNKPRVIIYAISILWKYFSMDHEALVARHLHPAIIEFEFNGKRKMNGSSPMEDLHEDPTFRIKENLIVTMLEVQSIPVDRLVKYLNLLRRIPFTTLIIDLGFSDEDSGAIIQLLNGEKTPEDVLNSIPGIRRRLTDNVYLNTFQKLAGLNQQREKNKKIDVEILAIPRKLVLLGKHLQLKRDYAFNLFKQGKYQQAVEQFRKSLPAYKIYMKKFDQETFNRIWAIYVETQGERTEILVIRDRLSEGLADGLKLEGIQPELFKPYQYGLYKDIFAKYYFDQFKSETEILLAVGRAFVSKALRLGLDKPYEPSADEILTHFTNQLQNQHIELISKILFKLHPYDENYPTHAKKLIRAIEKNKEIPQIPQIYRDYFKGLRGVEAEYQEQTTIEDVYLERAKQLGFLNSILDRFIETQRDEELKLIGRQFKIIFRNQDYYNFTTAKFKLEPLYDQLEQIAGDHPVIIDHILLHWLGMNKVVVTYGKNGIQFHDKEWPKVPYEYEEESSSPISGQWSVGSDHLSAISYQLSVFSDRLRTTNNEQRALRLRSGRSPEFIEGRVTYLQLSIRNASSPIQLQSSSKAIHIDGVIDPGGSFKFDLIIKDLSKLNNEKMTEALSNQRPYFPLDQRVPFNKAWLHIERNLFQKNIELEVYRVRRIINYFRVIENIRLNALLSSHDKEINMLRIIRGLYIEVFYLVKQNPVLKISIFEGEDVVFELPELKFSLIRSMIRNLYIWIRKVQVNNYLQEKMTIKITIDRLILKNKKVSFMQKLFAVLREYFAGSKIYNGDTKETRKPLKKGSSPLEEQAAGEAFDQIIEQVEQLLKRNKFQEGIERALLGKFLAREEGEFNTAYWLLATGYKNVKDFDTARDYLEKIQKTDIGKTILGDLFVEFADLYFQWSIHNINQKIEYRPELEKVEQYLDWAKGIEQRDPTNRVWLFALDAAVMLMQSPEENKELALDDVRSAIEELSRAKKSITENRLFYPLLDLYRVTWFQKENVLDVAMQEIWETVLNSGRPQMDEEFVNAFKQYQDNDEFHQAVSANDEHFAIESIYHLLSKEGLKDIMHQRTIHILDGLNRLSKQELILYVLRTLEEFPKDPNKDTLKKLRGEVDFLKVAGQKIEVESLTDIYNEILQALVLKKAKIQPTIIMIAEKVRGLTVDMETSNNKQDLLPEVESGTNNGSMASAQRETEWVFGESILVEFEEENGFKVIIKVFKTIPDENIQKQVKKRLTKIFKDRSIEQVELEETGENVSEQTLEALGQIIEEIISSSDKQEVQQKTEESLAEYYAKYVHEQYRLRQQLQSGRLDKRKITLFLREYVRQHLQAKQLRFNQRIVEEAIRYAFYLVEEKHVLDVGNYDLAKLTSTLAEVAQFYVIENRFFGDPFLGINEQSFFHILRLVPAHERNMDIKIKFNGLERIFEFAGAAGLLKGMESFGRTAMEKIGKEGKTLAQEIKDLFVLASEEELLNFIAFILQPHSEIIKIQDKKGYTGYYLRAPASKKFVFVSQFNSGTVDKVQIIPEGYYEVNLYKKFAEINYREQINPEVINRIRGQLKNSHSENTLIFDYEEIIFYLIINNIVKKKLDRNMDEIRHIDRQEANSLIETINDNKKRFLQVTTVNDNNGAKASVYFNGHLVVPVPKLIQAEEIKKAVSSPVGDGKINEGGNLDIILNIDRRLVLLHQTHKVLRHLTGIGYKRYKNIVINKISRVQPSELQKIKKGLMKLQANAFKDIIFSRSVLAKETGLSKDYLGDLIRGQALGSLESLTILMGSLLKLTRKSVGVETLNIDERLKILNKTRQDLLRLVNETINLSLYKFKQKFITEKIMVTKSEYRAVHNGLKYFQKELRSKRIKINVSLIKMAKLMKKPKTTMIAIEKGDRFISIGDLVLYDNLVQKFLLAKEIIELSIQERLKVLNGTLTELFKLTKGVTEERFESIIFANTNATEKEYKNIVKGLKMFQKDKLSRLMTEKGVSQRDVGNYLEMTGENIWYYESGKYLGAFEFIRKLVQAIDRVSRKVDTTYKRNRRLGVLKSSKKKRESKEESPLWEDLNERLGQLIRQSNGAKFFMEKNGENGNGKVLKHVLEIEYMLALQVVRDVGEAKPYDIRSAEFGVTAKRFIYTHLILQLLIREKIDNLHKVLNNEIKGEVIEEWIELIASVVDSSLRDQPLVQQLLREQIQNPHGPVQLRLKSGKETSSPLRTSVSYQLSAISHQLSTVSIQWSVFSDQNTGHRRPATGDLLTTYHLPFTTNNTDTSSPIIKTKEKQLVDMYRQLEVSLRNARYFQVNAADQEIKMIVLKKQIALIRLENGGFEPTKLIFTHFRDTQNVTIEFTETLVRFILGDPEHMDDNYAADYYPQSKWRRSRNIYLEDIYLDLKPMIYFNVPEEIHIFHAKFIQEHPQYKNNVFSFSSYPKILTNNWIMFLAQRQSISSPLQNNWMKIAPVRAGPAGDNQSKFSPSASAVFHKNSQKLSSPVVNSLLEWITRYHGHLVVRNQQYYVLLRLLFRNKRLNSNPYQDYRADFPYAYLYSREEPVSPQEFVSVVKKLRRLRMDMDNQYMLLDTVDISLTSKDLDDLWMNDEKVRLLNDYHILLARIKALTNHVASFNVHNFDKGELTFIDNRLLVADLVAFIPQHLSMPLQQRGDDLPDILKAFNQQIYPDYVQSKRFPYNPDRDYEASYKYLITTLEKIVPGFQKELDVTASSPVHSSASYSFSHDIAQLKNALKAIKGGDLEGAYRNLAQQQIAAGFISDEQVQNGIEIRPLGGFYQAAYVRNLARKNIKRDLIKDALNLKTIRNEGLYGFYKMVRQIDRDYNLKPEFNRRFGAREECNLCRAFMPVEERGIDLGEYAAELRQWVIYVNPYSWATDEAKTTPSFVV